MYIDVRNSFSFVRDGDLPIHLLKLFKFQLQQNLYQARNLPNLPMANKSIYFPQWKCFLTGALPFLLKEYPCHVVDNRVNPLINKDSIKTPEWLRPHQKDAFKRMLDLERGIINHTTSTGKTYLASAWASVVPLNHLIIVHRKEIYMQFVERFTNDLQADVDQIWGPVFDYQKRRVAIAMIQSLYPRIKSKEIDLSFYQSVIVDESHHAGWGSQYCEMLILGDNLFFRFGLSATPKRGAGDTIVPVGLIGPILHEYRYKDAIADKFITPVHVCIVRLPPSFPRHIAVEPYPPFYKIMIVDNVVRNNVIADIAVTCIMMGKPTLVIAKQLTHIATLLDLIRNKIIMKGWTSEEAARKIDLVHGKDPERFQKKEDFENGNLRCLIGTSLYDEGIDIHAISSVILAAGERSERALLQRIGRGQRLADEKKMLLVFDFWDDFHPKTKQHSEKRLKVLKKEGYEIDVIKHSGS